MNEPWDSPANKKVLEQMPNVFRNPFDDPKSTSSGYYVLTGQDTIFDPSLLVEFRYITDGTSNTFLVVEAKRNVPWTKPEDIPFDRDRTVPALGGFVPGEFWAAMCDGSVHRLSTERVKDDLKWLILRNDMHPVDLEALGMQEFGSSRRPLALVMERGAARPSATLAIDVRSAGLEVTLKGEHLSSVANAAAAPYSVQIPLEAGEYRLSIKSTARNPFREYVSKEPVSIQSGHHRRLAVEFVDRSRDIQWTGIANVEVVAMLDDHRLELVPANRGSLQE
jgi:hypothetical protein